MAYTALKLAFSELRVSFYISVNTSHPSAGVSGLKKKSSFLYELGNSAGEFHPDQKRCEAKVKAMCVSF